MHKATFLDHTADMRLLIEATSLEELFQAGVDGLSQLMSPLKKSKTDHVEELSINSIDRTSLLVDFLSDVLLLSHLKKVIFERVEFIALTNESLKAKIYGTPVDGFIKDVKAVTYHEAEVIERNDGSFQATIIFDI